MFTLKNINEPVTTSAMVKRLGICYKRSKGIWRWAAFNSSGNQLAWITSHYRVLGIKSTPPTNALAETELLIGLELPLQYSGKALAAHIQQTVARRNAANRRSGRTGEAMYQCGRL